MKIVKRISLIIIGIILSLIVLEIGLQLAGFTITAVKKYKNKVTKDPNTITILCLGESTTDGQWPPILQRILDKKSKNKKFNVIDEGHAAKNTEYLFYEVVEKKLLKYNPDIVVSMMGINDSTTNKPYIMQNSHWYYKLRIYRLIMLIRDHLDKKIKYSELNNAEKNINIQQNIIKTIEEIATNTDKSESNKNLSLIKSITQKYSTIHWYENMIPALVNPYFTEIILNKENKYLFKLDDFIEYYKLNIEYLELSKVYICFAKKFFEQKDIYNAVRCAKTSLLYANCYNSVEQILIFDKPEIQADKIKYNLYQDDQNEPITKTIYNYTICYIFNHNKNIKYIVMQYPTISIKPLKENLISNPFYDKLTFVSNEENFKQALQKYKTEEVFRDMFGSSFGHCTELGNTIIAENVAETILKLYN